MKNYIIFILTSIILFICLLNLYNINNSYCSYNNYRINEYYDKPKKFKATNPGYGKIVSVDEDGNLNTFEFPKGIIVAWSGDITKIPDGWTICNGTNGAPDLRGRFILGANPNANKNSNFITNEINAKGGREKALLKHTHTIDGNNYFVGGAGDWKIAGGNFYTGLNSGRLSIAGNVEDNDTDTTLPPYYALAYIMKL